MRATKRRRRASSKEFSPFFADANAPWRSALLIESPVSRFQTPRSRFTGVRTATLKYVRYDSGFEQLFDLRTDPYELRNEARKASCARNLASLRSLNEALKSCTGAGCFVP